MTRPITSTGRSQNPSQGPHTFTAASSFSTSSRAYLTREILPGRVGRLHYQATEWSACALNDVHIPAGVDVVLVERQGNTWLVTISQPASAAKTWR